MLGGGATGGGGGLGLDLTAVIQAAVVGLVLFSAAVVAVRRAASRYFVVDAAGFAASYDDHHHSQDAYTMPSKNGDAAGETGPCAECGGVTSKKCSGCKRVRYCSSECQSKHWRSDHKFKCKQMKLLDPADKLSCGGDKSSGFGRISLVPRRKKFGKVLFPYDEFLKLYNWKDFEYIPCGLMNCGNSCFANVVLQCLSCTRPLVAYLLGKDHSRECSTRHDDWCFLCELQSHIQKASESLHPFAPMNILSHLPNIGGNLGFGRQEDAHEFMRFAIDKMQSACLDEYGGEKAVDLSTQETTIIQHIFGGRLQSQVQCTACGMVSNRYDNMMDLTVEIQGDAESLEKCLDQFTAVEWLDGDNKYKCDGCNDYVKARKHLSVHQAPNILTITLKRFQSGRFGKLNKRVTFPMELDLTPYMSTTDGSDLYDLYAVVVHLDMLNASFFGHYICYIKGYRGTWYKIDDCKVMTVDEEEVHAQGAYMLLYSRRTARPRPLTAVEEPIKEQQQCKVLPSNGQNHLILADASLSCESPSKSSEDLLQQDSEPNDESLHKMDTINQEPDLGLHTSSEDNKFIVNENLHSTGSPASHVFEDSSAPGSLLESNMSMGTAQLDPPLEHPTTMNSVQFANSTNEAFSVHSFTEQSEEPASSIDSVDYMDIDTEAGAEVTRWNEGPPVLDNSVEKTDDETLIPSFANGMTRKPKPLFSRGFLDKGTTKRSSFVEEGHIGGNNSQKLNGHCNGHHSSVEQAVLVNSCGSDISTGSAKCNGDMFETPSNGNYYATNGETQFRNDSLHAQYQDVPSVARGFEPRPYRNPSGSNKNCRDTKPLLDGQNKSSLLLPSKEGISFLHRGFLERPCSETKSVKVDGTLAFNNGKLPFVNGNNRPINNSSSPRGLSRGYTRHHKETAVIGTSMTSMQGLETSSGTSIEQKPNGAAVVSERVEERLTSDCTSNGSSFQLSANSDHNASTHLDENCHAILATKNTSCGLEIDNNGSPDLKGLGCQRNEPPAIENSMEYENNGLRRRTSKFFEQNGIDAK